MEVFALFAQMAWTQNIAPTLTAIGNQPYCPQSEINIVTDFNVVDPDDTEIEAFYIQISTGYVLGEDSLILLGAHPNIVSSWNSLEGKLTLTGSTSIEVSYVDFIAAIKDIVFQSTSNNPSDKVFSITIGDANYLPLTGHYYEYVPAYGITWADARVAAENLTYFGLQGYLATILYPEEAQLAGEQAPGAGWLGGSDEETEGVWKWVTGPESGTVFWNGGNNGSTPNYANWNINQPDNAHGGPGEDYLHITDPSIGIRGAWNDLRIAGDPPGPYHPKGFIVEYGGMPGDPIINIAGSTSIYTPSIIDSSPGSVCGSGTVNLSATASSGDVLWFDVPTVGTPLFSGQNFTTPVINTTTTYYLLASENGCEDGVRVPIVATVYEEPTYQSNIAFTNCDADSVPNDGFTDFNLEEVNDIITSNNAYGLYFSYHLTYLDADSNTNNITSPNSYNNSNGNTIYVRIFNDLGCHVVSTVNLQITTTSFSPNYFEVLQSCDDSTEDGFYGFDLGQMSPLFISQFPSGQNLSVHYFEHLEDAQLEQNEILQPNNYVNTEPFLQTLYVRVESGDNGGCFGIGPHLILNVLQRPEFEVDNSAFYCSNAQPIRIPVVNAKGNYAYEWRDETGNIISTESYADVFSGGSFNVIARSSLGCESFPVSFSVAESNVAEITLEDLTIVDASENNTITINNNSNNLGIGDYEFALDDEDGYYQDTPFFDRVQPGSHMIYVRDKSGCGVTSIEVFILGFPKFFTPNSDGYNDFWQVEGLGSDFNTNESKIIIYDRYGKLIKQLTAKSGAWDGTLNGQLLPNSDYWFVAELVKLSGELKTYRGHFSLIR